MTKQLTGRWWLALVAAVVGIGVVFYSVTPPVGIRPCSSHLVVHFGEPLQEGLYQMEIVGDDYVAHCRITVVRQAMEPPDCGDALGSYSAAPPRFIFPTRSAQVKIDLRRDGQPLIARTVAPHYAGSPELSARGCESAEVYVPFGFGASGHSERDQ
jgi:hypothetical protein